MPAEKIISELVTEYGDSILRMCYLYLKDYHLAEDVVQETFLQVYNNYESFQKQSSIKTWIIRIAINLCKNQMRTRWFSVNRKEEFPLLTYAEDYEGIIDRERLITAIGNLKTKYREAVLLFYYQELSVKEIAALLDKKESTVKARLRRAREQLRQELKEDYFYE